MLQTDVSDFFFQKYDHCQIRYLQSHLRPTLTDLTTPETN